MITINNFHEIKEKAKNIKLNEKFFIIKGKHKSVFKIKEHSNFEGYFAIFQCENIAMSMCGGSYVMPDKYFHGADTIQKCIESAYYGLR